MNVKISFRHEFQEQISVRHESVRHEFQEDIAETKRKQEETLNVHQELSNTQLAEQLQAVADAQKALADAEEASKISAKVCFHILVIPFCPSSPQLPCASSAHQPAGLLMLPTSVSCHILRMTLIMASVDL